MSPQTRFPFIREILHPLFREVHSNYRSQHTFLLYLCKVAYSSNLKVCCVYLFRHQSNISLFFSRVILNFLLCKKMCNNNRLEVKTYSNLILYFCHIIHNLQLLLSYLFIVQGEGFEPSRAYANSLEDYDASSYVLTLLNRELEHRRYLNLYTVILCHSKRACIFIQVDQLQQFHVEIQKATSL